MLSQLNILAELSLSDWQMKDGQLQEINTIKQVVLSVNV